MFLLDKAKKRKNRSIKTLRKEGVPYIDHLPVIETETNVTLRSKVDVSYRAYCLGLIAALGEGLEIDVFWDKVDEFGIKDYLTPDEIDFANLEVREVRDRAKFTWRYESLWVLLWSLGFVDELDRPDHICDVQKAVTFLIAQPVEEFIKKANLRDKKLILDEADLIFRYHWATTDGRLKGVNSVAGLDGGVVFERHYALNWLIDAYDEDWDSVSTNT